MTRQHRWIDRWLPWFFCVVVGVVVGVGSFTFYYGKGFSYLSSDPKACINCHVMQGHYDSWVKSSHHVVAKCNDCHIPHEFPQKYMVKLRSGWNHSKAFTLQNFKEPIRLKPRDALIAQKNCLHCHDVLTSEIASHQNLKNGSLRCIECHRSVGHMGLS